MSDTAERMSRVDNAWLRMDNDVNLMMIVGVWLLQPALRYQQVCERIGQQLLQYPRFRQKVVEDVLGASWVDDEDFDIKRHVVRETLPRKRGQNERAALQARCGELATTRLDPAHPLWQFHLVEHYEGGSAIVVRIHHCIGDGIALTSVVLSITDGGALPPQRSHDAVHDEDDWLTTTLLRPLTDLAVKAIDLSGEGVSRSMDLVAHPQAGTRELARTGYRVATDLAALALMEDDSPTRLKGKPVGRKIVAWGEPIPLDVVKCIGKALNASINDVLLSCVAGAIGDYLREIGDDPSGKGIRAMVPVNLRPLDEAYKLGNRFGLAPLVLPIGIDNPIERVYAVRARMSELKGSYQPVLAFGVLAVAGLLNKAGQDALLNLFAKKATAVMTNVPGPTQLLEFCGSTLRQSIFWVPQSGNVAVGVSIFSYGGGVQFALITDCKLCPAPQQIIDRFAPELEKLLWVTLMLPWAA
ncbi:MAG: putative diacylglycerol O-acyltransferase [Proteobacteria bacterium]|jgi:diacylglycerol O-acyltransferase / wax synthase|nr:putative diacylglycerol O-acyltransferase [Pseudomonadota bacterium]